MKLHRLFLVTLSAAALALAGCGGDDDDDGGSSGTGSGGGDNHGLAGTQITAANASQVQSTVMQGIGQAMGKGPGTHNGANSGTVKITLSTGKVAQSVRYTLDFDDYSDDGQVFLNGTVRYNMNYSTSGQTLLYTFDIDVSGSYSGAVEGEISMANGVYGGYWNVNGTRINF